VREDGFLKLNPGSLWAGMQAKGTGCKHNGLNVHARISPISPGQIVLLGRQKT